MYQATLEQILLHVLEFVLIVVQECEKCRVSSEDDRRRSAELTRENQRHKQQAYDLSRQVTHILHTAC